ncbi:MAG TPA: TIGR03435 family protein [Acidobacteriaceae bacterium]
MGSAVSCQSSAPATNADPHGDTAPGTLPAFAAATIKPSKQGDRQPIGLYIYPGGRIYAGLSTFKMLVCDAFNLRPFQVEGGPKWTETDLYDVSAVPPDTSKSRQSNPRYINDAPSNEQREMLKSLLIERFGLKSHWASRESTVLFLERSNKPLAMTKAKHDNSFPILAIGGRGDGGMMGSDLSMQYMAARLAIYLDRPVLDRTALKGSFDFQLPPPLDDSHEQSEIDFTNVIVESLKQIGLTLKSGKAPLDILVIDDVNRPTPN